MKTKMISLLCVGLAVTSVEGIAGEIRGRIRFEGTAPPDEKIVVVSDTSVCGTHQTAPKVLVGEGGGIANAVVRLVGPFPSAQSSDGKLDQIKCQFEPHVQVVPVGSKLILTSSDTVLHNAHGFDEAGKDLFNIAVPIAGMKIPIQLKTPGRIKIRCDAGHTWMSAYIIVAEHPYYAVTDKAGMFDLKEVPAGNYTIEVWQESLGKQEQKVEIKATGETEVQFRYQEGKK